MKHREVIEKILEYHPNIPNYSGCDDYKAGNPDDECTGVVCAMVATPNVIRKAKELGANLIIVHEPTYYTSADRAGWFEDFPNSIYEEKKAMIEEYGITVWRDHDHMHMHNPDGIFTGVLRYLGWEDSATVDFNTGAYAHFLVDVPEMTLQDLLKHLVDTIGMNGTRYIGKPDMKVKKIAIVGHLFPMELAEKKTDGTPKDYGEQIMKVLENGVDVIIPGEVIDWTVLSYVRDAMELHGNKAMINLGHFNWEELGMRYCKDWLTELVGDEVPVTYVPSEDMYSFYVK
ncbi:MAG: Nif3-like dinuclear metal center hexameric protein [Clostridia bacterium]|nr:Nif3-like dinuclear metal center hexameric protein [Clostridia bacterium]